MARLQYPQPRVMSTLASVGPMLVMEGQAGQAGAPVPLGLPPHAPPYFGQLPPQMPPQFAHGFRAHPLQAGPGLPHPPHPLQQAGPGAVSTTSLNRSQRCGVCRGCQCKPCGHCTYCQDSPQFGGPGVKKQSCVERRCLRVLENRLQRDAPTFKARVGCMSCEDCKMPDCQTCLVCLDKRFFDNRYMTGALCAKKRCNNATSLELPLQNNNNNDRGGMKRSYDHGSAFEYGGKRRMEMMGPGSLHNGLMPTPIMMPMQRQVMPGMMGTNPYLQQRLPILHGMPPVQMSHAKYEMAEFNSNNLLIPLNTHQMPDQAMLPSAQVQPMPKCESVDSTSSSLNSSTPMSNPPSSSMQHGQPDAGCVLANASVPPSQPMSSCTELGPPAQQVQAVYSMGSYGQQQSPSDFMGYGQYGGVRYADKFYEGFKEMADQQNGVDPFTPPSYAPETKSAVFLQPL